MAAAGATYQKVKKNLLDDIDLRKPLLKGDLFKQAHTHKSFNKRYFVLYPNILVYYDNEQEFTRDLERKTLEHRDHGYLLDGLYLSKPEKKPQGAKFCFILHCPSPRNDRKELLLVAESREERKKWMDKLQEQNSSLLEHERKSSATLEVPIQRIRADSPNPESHGSEQNLDIVEGSSDKES